MVAEPSSPKSPAEAGASGENGASGSPGEGGGEGGEDEEEDPFAQKEEVRFLTRFLHRCCVRQGERGIIRVYSCMC